MTDQTDFSNLSTAEHEMVLRDREKIPTMLLRAMFGLAMASLALVTFAVVTERPLVGTPDPAEVVLSRQLILESDRQGAVVVRDEDGQILADHDPMSAGFISVIARALSRERVVHRITENPPVTITKLANGRMQLSDPATGWNVELGFFGDLNAERFAALIEQ